MALAFDANLGTNTGPAAASTIALVTTTAVAADGKIFIDVGIFGAETLSSVSGGGLTWNVDLKASNGSEHYARASADAPAGLASGTTITATFTGSTSGDRSISGFSATGVATGTTYDGTNSSTAGAGASWSSGSITTANADDILVGGGTEDGSGTATATPNSGYTEANDFNNATSAECWESVYQIVAATSSYTAGGTFSPTGTQSVGLLVAYKATAGAATVLPPLPLVVDTAVARAANY